MTRYRVFMNENDWKPYYIMGYYQHPGSDLGHWQQVSNNYANRKNAVNWAKKNGYKLENE